MKTTIFSAVMMFTALSLNANQPLKEVKNTHSAAASEAPDNDGIQANALYKFKGTIGTHRVTFVYEYWVQSQIREEQLTYMYDKIGKEIYLSYKGRNGKYRIFKEYVNGRCTGTFNINITPETITGHFVNYKNQRFKVYAKCISYGY
ncbi:MAG: hypothetical protein J6I60_03795 [Bacteroidaceae bacterium]|nr:hypothetical protein [Bacteroidaceae bacterium]